MLINTTSLVGTTAVTSGLGFAYWWAAARLYTPEAVGLASANVSTMMLLGGIGMCGFGTLLITELPRQPGREVSLISTGLVIVGVAAGGIGALFAIFAPTIFAQFAPLRASVLDIVAFAMGVSLMAATAVLDQALIGILQGNLQFWRNAFFSAAKLILLFIAGLYLSQKTGTVICMTWTVSMALSVVVVFVSALFKKGWQGKAYLPQWKILRELGPAALQHHLLNMVLQVPTQLLPVLVAMMLSAQMNGLFYISFMLANFIFVVPNSLSVVLHAMNSADIASLRQRARITMGISFAVSLVSIAALFLGAKLVLGLFGSIYAEQATWCLRIIILIAFPGIIKNHYISFCRIQDRIAIAMFATSIGGILELGGTVLGCHLGGLLGLSLGWLAAVTTEGLFMLPFVYKVIRPAKGIPEISLPERDKEAELIWLLDTIVQRVILPLPQTTAQLQVRVPMTTIRESEPIWLVDTLIQPAIRPTRSVLTQAPATPAPQGKICIGGNTLKKTVLTPLPVTSAAHQGKSIWQAQTSTQPDYNGPRKLDRSIRKEIIE